MCGRYRRTTEEEELARIYHVPKMAYKTINARLETVDTVPSYRQAFKKRRCLIPADGFYEWKNVVRGKIPYSIGYNERNS